MSKIQKKGSLFLSTLLVVGLLLASTIGAMAAATPFTLMGTLVYDGTNYSVESQMFVLAPAVVCTDLNGATLLSCADLATKLVEVKGTSEADVWTATEITELGTYTGLLKVAAEDAWTVDTEVFVVDTATVLPPFSAVDDTVMVTYKMDGTDKLALEIVLVSSDPDSTYTYRGVIGSLADDVWGVGGYDFVITGDTALPPFYAVNDTVDVTFKMVGTDYVALDIVLVASDPNNTYEYEGELKDFSETEWLVDGYTFNIEDVSLPIYFGKGDIVKVTFKITAEGYIATEVTIVETYVPFKVDSSRCELRYRNHPGVQKVADEVGATYEEILGLFCKGFGLGEIKLAYKHAAGSLYTPEMLLALRAQGYSWGDLKKMAAGNPADEDGDEVTGANPGNGKNKEKGTPPGLEKKNNNDTEGSEVADGPGNSENAPGHTKDKDKDKDKDKNKDK